MITKKKERKRKKNLCSHLQEVCRKVYQFDQDAQCCSDLDVILTVGKLHCWTSTQLENWSVPITSIWFYN